MKGLHKLNDKFIWEVEPQKCLVKVIMTDNAMGVGNILNNSVDVTQQLVEIENDKIFIDTELAELL